MSKTKYLTKKQFTDGMDAQKPLLEQDFAERGAGRDVYLNCAAALDEAKTRCAATAGWE